MSDLRRIIKKPIIEKADVRTQNYFENHRTSTIGNCIRVKRSRSINTIYSIVRGLETRKCGRSRKGVQTSNFDNFENRYTDRRTTFVGNDSRCYGSSDKVTKNAVNCLDLLQIMQQSPSVFKSGGNR